MKLVHKDTKEEVKVGELLTSFRGDKYYAHYWTYPHHGIGKITVRKKLDDMLTSREFYVSVFNLEWVI